MSKQGYHFVGNDQFSGFFFGSRRSKMFPKGFIDVCNLRAWKVIFREFGQKINFFLQINHNGEHIKNSKKKF